MALVFLGFGSNLGNGRENIRNAWNKLKAHPKITPFCLASPYSTAPVGMESSNWFTNSTGAIETSLSPEELLEVLLDIEKGMGRNRALGEDRIIDLDILYYDDLICNLGHLLIPHPEIANRLFVLEPLMEIAPDHLHPVSGLTTQRMRSQRRFADQRIEKMSWDATP